MVDTSVQEIDEATDTQVDSTQEVVSMVDDVEGTSARTAVAAAAAEQTTELAEVPTLSERVESLEASLDPFELVTDGP
jgi:sn-glycerol 3-phosphate transport system substrate-binding protein